MEDRHDARSKHNHRKSKCSKQQPSWGSGGDLSLIVGGFRGWSPLRQFLGPKEHIDWLKIDLNANEIITVQDYKCTKN